MTDKSGFNKGGMVTLVIGDERHEGLTADPDILARLREIAVARHGPINEAFSKITTTPASSWTDDAKAELHLLAQNLRIVAFQVGRKSPCAEAILEGYAIRIDELMKRAPEVVS